MTIAVLSGASCMPARGGGRTAALLLAIGAMLAGGCRTDVSLGRRCPIQGSACQPSGSADASEPEPGVEDAGRAQDTGTAEDAGPVEDGGMAVDVTAGRVAIESGTWREYCDGHGSPLRATRPADDSASACEPDVTTELFAAGLCSCGDVALGGGLTLDWFDATGAAVPSGEPGVVMGVNGSLSGLSYLTDIHGDLTIAGDAPLDVYGSLLVARDLRTNGAIGPDASDVRIERDAWIAGDILADAPLEIGGDLHQPLGRMNVAAPSVGGDVHAVTFTIEAPCRCDEESALDVAALVGRAASVADNDELGIARGSDGGAFALGAVLTAADCGRFAVSGSAGLGFATVSGRVALFVDGDVSVDLGVFVDLGTSGQLDLFVAGDLEILGLATVGVLDRPSDLRIYVGGDRVTIAGGVTLAANLYAPNAAVEVAGTVTVFGSIFAGDYATSGAQSIFFDRAVLSSDSSCL